MKRFFLFAKWTGMVVAFFLLVMAGGRLIENADTDRPQSANGSARNKKVDESHSAANGPIRALHPGEQPTTKAGGSPVPLDFSQTSWEEPFSAAHWRSKGWSFDGKSMTSRDKKNAKATFRRTYRKLMIEMSVERLAKRQTLRVKLDALGTVLATKISIGNGAVVVSGQEKPHAAREIKRKSLDLTVAGEKPGVLRVVATGNRIFIHWNGRRVLTCSQPAEQSGRDLHITLATNDSGIRISQMRIEGE